MREWILTSLSNPAIAASVLTLGLFLAAIEFLRPGRVIPAAIGGVMIVTALWSLLPGHAAAAICGAAILAPLAGAMAAAALRARRNKAF